MFLLRFLINSLHCILLWRSTLIVIRKNKKILPKRNEKTKQCRISAKTKPKDLSKLIQSYLAFCAWANSFLANSKSFKTAASGLLPSGASDLLIFLFFTSLGWFNLKQKRSYQFQLMDSGNLLNRFEIIQLLIRLFPSVQEKMKMGERRKAGNVQYLKKWSPPITTRSACKQEWGRVKITGEYRPQIKSQFMSLTWWRTVSSTISWPLT